MKKLSGILDSSARNKWFSSLNKGICLPLFVQDPIHIGTKLRNFILGLNHKPLAFGPKYKIEMQHLFNLLNTVSKDHHLLTASTLNPSDRQNFKNQK